VYCLNIKESSFTFFACTLRRLAPHSSRYRFSPPATARGLGGQNSISLSGLQVLINLTVATASDFSMGAINGGNTHRQESPHLHFQIKTAH